MALGPRRAAACDGGGDDRRRAGSAAVGFSAFAWMAHGGRVRDAVHGAGRMGVIPAHLSELSPPEARGLFTGLAYQLGVMFAANAAFVEALMAKRMSYAAALATVASDRPGRRRGGDRPRKRAQGIRPARDNRALSGIRPGSSLPLSLTFRYRLSSRATPSAIALDGAIDISYDISNVSKERIFL